ncbi:metallophosphoesterase family protein [Planosporangium sp. 12N6]|uniref:metallophosphoesterase family protein n=1 Tax=Planosporangium spinosum TaxID=3402278 RepID=UPI003CEC744E
MLPEQLGFTPRRGVPWLSPTLLAGTAVRVVLAGLFGAYLDKRELQNALHAEIFDERPGAAGDVRNDGNAAGEVQNDGNVEPGGAAGNRDDADQGELWLDYVADLGDGFNATYSVAYLLAQPRLTVDGAALPRGRVLVMGGDQVYPTASWQQYEDRFKGPYEAALPRAPLDGDQPTMYALPGNHDWYDGLTAFLRLFTRGHGKVGGWRTRQTRSYFAIRLPHRWWLFAIDAQLDAYIDDPQLHYFRRVAERLRPGDRIILCPPNPTWVEAVQDRQAYDTVDYFIRTVIDPTGAQVRLMLSGDLHHYARYTRPDRELITCGGGGAYLYPTHRLPQRLDVPPKTTLVRKKSPSEEYRLAATFPTRSRSRQLAAGVFTRLPWRNPGFVSLLGTIHLLLLFAFLGAAQRMSGLEQRLFTIPFVGMVFLVLGATLGFSMPSTAGRRRFRHWALGAGHGAAQLGLGVFGAWAWTRLSFHDLPWPLPLLLGALLYLPVSGLLAGWIVAGYLLVASTFDVNVNELFAAQGIVDHKSFLRLHVGRDGTLTIYPIAVDRVGRRWRPAPDAPADRPWLEPTRPLTVRLAEEPIRLG